MNMPLDNQHDQNVFDDRLLDRLVDGELLDTERRLLLQRLEAEPDGWRRCALAFLEAQAWHDSLGPATDSVVDRSIAATAAAPTIPAPRRLGGRLFASFSALAACVAVAFALGWSMRPQPAGVTSNVLVANGAPSPPHPADGTVAIGSSTTGQEISSPVAKAPAPSLEAVLKKWEQRGYRAERQDRVLPVELKDGRKVNVPVQEYRIQYLGGRTY
jgi:hypothetical protein